MSGLLARFYHSRLLGRIFHTLLFFKFLLTISQFLVLNYWQ